MKTIANQMAIITLLFAVMFPCPAGAVQPNLPDILSAAELYVPWCRSKAVDMDVTSVASGGEFVCIYGPITAETGKIFFSKKFDGLKYVIVNSRGGDGEAALAIGEYLLDHDVTIIVDDVCMSACANFIFLGSRWKVVLEGGGVAWHGNFNGARNIRPGDSKERQELYIRLRQRADAFLTRVGIRGDLVGTPPPDQVEILKKLAAEYGAGGTMFWTYSAEKLRDEFNVQGILQYEMKERK